MVNFNTKPTNTALYGRFSDGGSMTFTGSLKDLDGFNPVQSNVLLAVDPELFYAVAAYSFSAVSCDFFTTAEEYGDSVLADLVNMATTARYHAERLALIHGSMGDERMQSVWSLVAEQWAAQSHTLLNTLTKRREAENKPLVSELEMLEASEKAAYTVAFNAAGTPDFLNLALRYVEAASALRNYKDQATEDTTQYAADTAGSPVEPTPEPEPEPTESPLVRAVVEALERMGARDFNDYPAISDLLDDLGEFSTDITTAINTRNAELAAKEAVNKEQDIVDSSKNRKYTQRGIPLRQVSGVTYCTLRSCTCSLPKYYNYDTSTLDQGTAQKSSRSA